MEMSGGCTTPLVWRRSGGGELHHEKNMLESFTHDLQQVNILNDRGRDTVKITNRGTQQASF